MCIIITIGEQIKECLLIFFCTVSEPADSPAIDVPTLTNDQTPSALLITSEYYDMCLFITSSLSQVLELLAKHTYIHI